MQGSMGGKCLVTLGLEMSCQISLEEIRVRR